MLCGQFFETNNFSESDSIVAVLDDTYSTFEKDVKERKPLGRLLGLELKA